MSDMSSATPSLAELEARHPSFLDLFYQTLFYPVTTFRSIASGPWADNRMLFYALGAVILVSATAPAVHLAASGGTLGGLIALMPVYTVVGVFIWAFVALVLSLLSYAFLGETRIRTFLVLSALATLPWLLMGPVMLFKAGLGQVGDFISAVLGLCIWLWTTLLFALAVMCTYRMSVERVLVIFLLPLASLLIVTGWVAGFVLNVAHLMPG
jgi:hypothetical protein